LASNLFFFAVLAKAAKQDWLEHHVLDTQSYLVVTQSGSGSGDVPWICPGLMPSNLALDRDLGPDPNPGSAVLQFRILCEPEEANIFIF
jgi:hypothetical protein